MIGRGKGADLPQAIDILAQPPFLAALAAAVFWLGLMGRPLGPVRALVKALPMALMAWAVQRAGGPALLSAALALSALGDAALALRSRAAFLYGLSAFALAHLLYLLLMGGLAGAPLWEVFSSAPIAALAVLGLMGATEIWLAPHAGALRWPVRVYVLLIGAMILAALLLWPRSPVPAIGAWLFAASDTILALERFRLPARSPLRRISAPAIWGLYAIAQALLAAGLTALA